MRLLLVSDLHLAPSVRALKQWQDFLRAARDVDVLYILGDLFEYWVGDRQLQDPFFYEIALTLEQFTRKIAPVFLLPGNRDFLLGKILSFHSCAATGRSKPYSYRWQQSSSHPR